MTQPALAQEVKGKGRMYPSPTGEMVPSVTNVLKVFDKSAPLMWWAAKTCVSAICDDPDGFLDAIAEDPDAAINTFTGKYKEATKDAADRGSQVHGYLDRRIGFGEDDATAAEPLSAEARLYLPGARKFINDHPNIRGLSEVTVCGLGYAGTADFVGSLDGKSGPVVVDYKTRSNGKHAVYETEYLQLAALRWATHRAFVGEDGEPQFVEMPPREGAVLVTFTTTSYKTHPITNRTGEDALDAFLALRDVWTWMKAEKPKKARAKAGAK